MICPACGHDPNRAVELIHQGSAVTEIRVEMHENAGRAAAWDSIAGACESVVATGRPGAETSGVLSAIARSARTNAAECQAAITKALIRVEHIGGTTSA